MAQWWVRRWKTVVLVIGGLAVIILGSLALKWMGLDPNAFAAVASALAAIAAFASARESSSTARDAIRALSLSSKPAPSLTMFDIEGLLAITVANESVHPISRGTIAWKLRNGQRGTTDLGEIPGIRIASKGLTIGNPGPSRQYNVLPHPGRVNGIDEVTLDYWGTNGPIGWRIVQTFNHQYTTGSLPDGTGTSGYSAGSPSKTETELA
jgi:hypothetical protein